MCVWMSIFMLKNGTATGLSFSRLSFAQLNCFTCHLVQPLNSARVPKLSST